jgi:hypothetical protein
MRFIRGVRVCGGQIPYCEKLKRIFSFDYRLTPNERNETEVKKISHTILNNLAKN